MPRYSVPVLSQDAASSQKCPTCGQYVAGGKYLIIHHGHRKLRIPSHDIVARESTNGYTRIHPAKPIPEVTEMLIEVPLYQLISEMPGEFLQVRRNWAVRTSNITELNGSPDNFTVEVLGVGTVPVGRRVVQAIRKHLIQSKRLRRPA